MSTSNRIYMIKTNARMMFNQNVKDILNGFNSISRYHTKKFEDAVIYIGSYAIDIETRERVKIDTFNNGYKGRPYKKIDTEGNVYFEIFVICEGKGARTVAGKIYKNACKNELNPSFPTIISNSTRDELLNVNYTFYHRKLGVRNE